MAAIYGGQFQSLFDGLADHLRDVAAPSQASEYERQVVLPARYLAKVLRAALEPELRPLLELRDWLKSVSAIVVKRQQRLRWTSPSGFVVVIGAKQKANPPARTLLHGCRGWETQDSGRRREELSVLASNRSITANLIHSFDAALVHAVIYRAEAAGALVLPNHDCFATVPARVRWLHSTIHDELRALYATDWLQEIRDEIACNSGVHDLPMPPMVQTLAPGTIGQNPYAFS
jgi:DNA-directed RNA polymerase